MIPEEIKKPKVFLSYSWTSPQHQQRVLDVADRLINEAGVEVIIDEYDLKGGQDVVAFMERLKTDATISNVIVLSDSTYAAKANSRERGVGKEAQIISPSVYEDIGQTRVIAVVMELTSDGHPCLPVFLESRLYFDFSSPQAENSNWERLIRHLWNKPIREKPKLGSPPEFMQTTEIKPSPHVRTKWKQLYSALMDGRPAVAVLREELLDTFESEITENSQLLLTEAAEKNEAIVDTWLKLLHLQSECGNLFFEWARTESLISADSSVTKCLVPILERISAIPSRSNNSPYNSPVFRDTLQAFAYEMSLYATATLIDANQPDSIRKLFQHPFVFGSDFHRSVHVGLSEFYFFSRIADSWNSAQPQRWISPLAQILSERIKHPKLSIEKLAEAEALIFVDAILSGKRSYPSTVVYAPRGKPFPWFLRASNSKDPDLLAKVVGRGNWDSLRTEFVTKFRESNKESRYEVFGRGEGDGFLHLLSFV